MTAKVSHVLTVVTTTMLHSLFSSNHLQKQFTGYYAEDNSLFLVSAVKILPELTTVMRELLDKTAKVTLIMSIKCAHHSGTVHLNAAVIINAFG